MRILRSTPPALPNFWRKRMPCTRGSRLASCVTSFPAPILRAVINNDHFRLEDLHCAVPHQSPDAEARGSAPHSATGITMLIILRTLRVLPKQIEGNPQLNSSTDTCVIRARMAIKRRRCWSQYSGPRSASAPISDARGRPEQSTLQNPLHNGQRDTATGQQKPRETETSKCPSCLQLLANSFRLPSIPEWQPAEPLEPGGVSDGSRWEQRPLFWKERAVQVVSRLNTGGSTAKSRPSCESAWRARPSHG